MPEYPKQRSKVVITYKDGHVQDTEISAGPRIMSYLVREARESGALVLRDDDADKSMLIPIDNVLNIEVFGLPPVSPAVEDLSEKLPMRRGRPKK